jgi:uncharacterized protein (DUF952 family)
MPYIYHIAVVADWESAQESGLYEVPSLKDEGFIHCSMEDQLSRVLDRFYSGRKDLVVLCIDSRKLKSQLVYEWAPSLEATFPHVYGPINIDAVTEVRSVDSMSASRSVA